MSRRTRYLTPGSVSRLEKLHRTVGNIRRPVRVMIISVPNSQNLSQRSLLSKVHFTESKSVQFVFPVNLLFRSFLGKTFSSISTDVSAISSIPSVPTSNSSSSSISSFSLFSLIIAAMLKLVLRGLAETIPSAIVVIGGIS